MTPEESEMLEGMKEGFAERAADLENTIDNLAMLVRRLISASRGDCPNLCAQAKEYLRRKNLIGSPLREVVQ